MVLRKDGVLFVARDHPAVAPPPPHWNPWVAGCGARVIDRLMICLLADGHDCFHKMRPLTDVRRRTEGARA